MSRVHAPKLVISSLPSDQGDLQRPVPGVLGQIYQLNDLDDEIKYVYKILDWPQVWKSLQTEGRIGKKNYLDKLEKQLTISQLEFHKTSAKYCAEKEKKLNAPVKQWGTAG